MIWRIIIVASLAILGFFMWQANNPVIVFGAYVWGVAASFSVVNLWNKS